MTGCLARRHGDHRLVRRRAAAGPGAIRAAALAGIVAAAVACTPTSAPPKGPAASAGAPPPAASAAALAAPRPIAARTYTLTVTGYNYTNRHIGQYSVEGAGGGNLDVSTPTAGGGKRECCLTWRAGTPLRRTLRVQWVAGGCMWHGFNSLGERTTAIRRYYKEVDAPVSPVVPANPGYVEVHIYPDEHVEIALSEWPSPPRLLLDPERAVDPYPNRCEDSK